MYLACCPAIFAWWGARKDTYLKASTVDIKTIVVSSEDEVINAGGDLGDQFDSYTVSRRLLQGAWHNMLGQASCSELIGKATNNRVWSTGQYLPTA
jgi:hypothetical protein